jgi:hypothetical protein
MCWLGVAIDVEHCHHKVGFVLYVLQAPLMIADSYNVLMSL